MQYCRTTVRYSKTDTDDSAWLVCSIKVKLHLFNLLWTCCGFVVQHFDLLWICCGFVVQHFDLLWTCCTTFRLVVDFILNCNHSQPSCTCKLKYSKKHLTKNKLCKPTNKRCSVLHILPTGVPNNTDSMLHASSFSSSVAFLVVSHRHVSFW